MIVDENNINYCEGTNINEAAENIQKLYEAKKDKVSKFMQQNISKVQVSNTLDY